MSTAQAPPRARHHVSSSHARLGQISRARHVVGALGGRFSVELGIDVDRDADGIERWALAATLIGSSPVSVAVLAYRVLERAGIDTFADVRRCDRERFTDLLDQAGYARGGESIALRLRALAEVVEHRYGAGLAAVGAEIESTVELERELAMLPAWDEAIVGTFLRELRGVWPGAEIALDPRAAQAARHVGLPSNLDGLAALAADSHLDLRDLEAGLIRLALVHDSVHCPGGEECPLAEADREQFVHFEVRRSPVGSPAGNPQHRAGRFP